MLNGCSSPPSRALSIAVRSRNDVHVDADDTIARRRELLAAHGSAADELFGRNAEPANQRQHAVGLGIVGDTEATNRRRTDPDLTSQGCPAHAQPIAFGFDRLEEPAKIERNLSHARRQ